MILMSPNQYLLKQRHKMKVDWKQFRYALLYSNQVEMRSSTQDELDADSIVLCISSEVANLRQSSFACVNWAMSRLELESNVKFTLNLEMILKKSC